MSIAELLAQLTHNIPDLRQAACRGCAQLFDADHRDREAIAQAKQVCASCPVLDACREWLSSLPKPSRPCGVVAGRYIPPPRLRTPYQPRPRPPSRREVATDWLRDYMAQNGPTISTAVHADATAAGISASSLHQAKVDLAVRTQRIPGGHGARFLWAR